MFTPLLIPVQLVLALALCVGPQTTDSDSSDQRELASGNNAFALDLYARLREQSGNLFVSPHSISTALAMTYAGARGETAAEMARVLHFSLDQPRLHAAFLSVAQRFQAEQAAHGYQLNLANALWVGADAGLLPTYAALVQKHYDAEARAVDFAHAEETCTLINEWVARKTAGKIPKLLTPDEVRDAVLVLTNAIYFKGTWRVQFDPQQTRDEPFVINGATSVTVPMMHQTTPLRCAAVDDVKLVELPYTGGDVTMLVILPNAADGLASVETALCEGRLDNWLGRLGEREVVLTLPRFEFRSHLKLGKTLKLLGMRLAFTPAADFSGMAPDVFIFAVIHEAYVKADEEGTEAAAATAVVVGRTSMPAPFEFRADHPFLFVIRNTHTGNILFLGRVQNPAS